MVFSGFTPLDEGRGRRRVAICDRPEDARLIAKAPEMLDLLVDALGNLDFAGGDEELTEDERAWRDRALALLSTLEVQ